MSRIGKKSIIIPRGVEVTATGSELRAKGAKGELSLKLHPHLSAVISAEEGGNFVRLNLKESGNKKDQALWGLYGALLRNMIHGVKDGWSKELELVGIGFKVAQKADALELEVGFSHPVTFPLPKGVSAKVEKNTITFFGIDKHLIGETAAQLRSIRPPEPYKGKGIKYVNEVILRKAGKAAKAGTASK